MLRRYLSAALAGWLFLIGAAAHATFPVAGVYEIRPGGSDTVNCGFFAPTTTLTADGAVSSANTTSPTVSSASYNFVSGDVGNWLFLKSGTGVRPAWYKITAVNAGVATIDADVGKAILWENSTPNRKSTAVGCSASSSLTSIQWTVDYSQTDTGMNITGLSLPANTFNITYSGATKAMIGNGIRITGGTGFTTGVGYINSVTTGSFLGTDRINGTASSTGGTATIGGGFATPGYTSSIVTTGGFVFCKYDASPYLATSATTNIAGGCVLGIGGSSWCGYDTSRFIFNTDANRPTFKLDSGVSTAVLFTGTNNTYYLSNFILDGNNQTASRGSLQSGMWWRTKVINCTSIPLSHNSATGRAIHCEVTACSGGTVGMSIQYGKWNWVHDNSFTANANNAGIIGAYLDSCICSNNANVAGFIATHVSNCVSVSNGTYGFSANNTNQSVYVNCISEGNTAGYQANTGQLMTLINCADYNNSSGRTLVTGSGNISDSVPISLTGSAFTNAASNDFSLNNTANAGAACRAAGFPSVFPGGLTGDYSDIGATQHQDAGGGGSGLSGRRGGLSGGTQ